jgi:hypothetical protein
MRLDSSIAQLSRIASTGVVVKVTRPLSRGTGFRMVDWEAMQSLNLLEG